MTGAKNERALLDDAMAAVASATARHWHPDDLQAVVQRSIDAMKAEGWLVETEIRTGRFRRGRGLQVDWPRTPWPSAGIDAAVVSTDPTAADKDDLQECADNDGGQLVNGVVND